jgi:hypothetical protein
LNAQPNFASPIPPCLACLSSFLIPLVSSSPHHSNSSIMGPVRDPLGTLDVNQPSTTNANAHASSSSVKLPLAKPVKLASIFTRPSRTSIHPRIPHEGESSASIRPDSPPSSSSPVEPSSPSPVRKRVKLTFPPRLRGVTRTGKQSNKSIRYDLKIQWRVVSRLDGVGSEAGLVSTPVKHHI